MRTLTPVEAQAFLREGTRTGKLATVRADGRPHIMPIWFVMDNNDIVFTTWHTTVKAANMRRDGRVGLCVDDETPPYAFVFVEGIAAIDEAAPDLQLWATRIAERYMGRERAPAYGQRNGVLGELLVRVTPTRIIAQTEVAH